MSLVALIITIIIGFWFSNAADAFPQILWGWVRWPNWLNLAAAANADVVVYER